jgi:hypothetical protein
LGKWPLQRGGPFLDHTDPFGAIEPQVAVGDHCARLLRARLGAKDEPGVGSRLDLSPRLVERRAAGRIRVGEAAAAIGEL